MLFRRFVSVLALSFAPAMASAQEAVPLTLDLFELPWWIVELDGAHEDQPGEPATLIITDLKAGTVVGDSPCGDAWTAKVKIDLPKVSFSNVQGEYDQASCPGYKNTIAMLDALKKVTHASTSPDGLEFRGADNRRLMLLVAGG